MLKIERLKMLKASAVPAFVGLWILNGCVQAEEKPQKATDADKVIDSELEKTDDESQEEEDSESTSTFVLDIDKVFLDKASSDDKALIKDCAESLAFPSTTTVVWPNELKVFLGKELKRLTAAEKILKHVSGIYLIDTTGAEDFPVVAGVVCGADPALEKVPVVMDLKMMTTDRKKHGSINKIVKYLTYEKGEEDNSYIVGHDGDFGVQTLIHELMHVYDLVYMPNSDDKKLIAAHKAANAIAWKTLSDDKHGVVDKFGLTGFGLTDEEPTQAQVLYNCSKNRKHRPLTYSDAQKGLSLNDDPFKRDGNSGELHKFLSFINQYSSTNRTEDFAETVTIYFAGTRYKDWPERTYYDFDSQGKRSLIYKFDAKDTATDSKLHRKKMCEFAKYVLGEDCSKYLE